MISLAEISRHVWACDPSYVDLFIDDLAALDAADLSVSSEAAKASPPYELRDGVAHIPINGMILRKVPPVVRAAGIPATSTSETAAALRDALADDAAKSIVFDIDSPGGTLAGTAELADLIYSAKGTKPIAAHAQDLAASAAYWIGSQVDRFTASQTAQIGSIGVYRVMIDTSEAAKQAGARVHVIRSGDHKGAGAPGAPVTDEQIEAEQSIIDRAAALFRTAVERSRDISAENAETLKTGRTWLAADAAGLGLVDGIETAGEAHRHAQSAEAAVPSAQPVEPLPVAAVDQRFNPKNASAGKIRKAIAAAGYSADVATAGDSLIARIYDPTDPENVAAKNGRLFVFWPKVVQAAHALESAKLSKPERAAAAEKLAAYFAAFGHEMPAQIKREETETTKESEVAQVAAGLQNIKEEKQMSDQELISEAAEVAELKAQLEAAQLRAEKAEAHANAAVVSLSSVRAVQKTDAIEAAAKQGKVIPAMRASVEAYAEKCGEDLADLNAFLAALPVQTAPNPIGVEQEQKDEEQKTDHGVAKVAQFFNRKPNEVEALASVRAVTTDGFAIQHDGSRTRLADIIKGA